LQSKGAGSLIIAMPSAFVKDERRKRYYIWPLKHGGYRKTLIPDGHL
jgi:hypothetical protein